MNDTVLRDGDPLQDGDLRLRPVRLPEDLALALPWYQDTEVLRFSEGEGTQAYDLATVERMYRYLDGCGELYVIEVETPRGWYPVGDVTLCRDTLPIVIGDPAYRSRGLGGRVLRLLVQRATDLGWPELKVKSIFTYNQRSRRLFEGAGFRLTGGGTDNGGREFWSFSRPLP